MNYNTVIFKSQQEVAKILGIPSYRINYLIESGKIPQPKRIGEGQGSTKFYSDFDVEIIRAALKAQGDKWKRNKGDQQ